MLSKAKLAPGVAKAFEAFILATNLSFGGPINNMTWEALYTFIRYTHSHNVRLGDDQMRDLLLSEGAQPNDAESIAQVYLHGRNLLYRKRPWDGQRMYSWLRSKKERSQALSEFKERFKSNSENRKDT